MTPSIVIRFEWRGVMWIVVDFYDGTDPEQMPDMPYAWKNQPYNDYTGPAVV